MKQKAEGMNPDRHKPTTWDEFTDLMRQILSAPGDAAPKSENRTPSKEELERRYRFEPNRASPASMRPPRQGGGDGRGGRKHVAGPAGFNEAPALRRGGLRARHPAAAVEAEASMRPPR